MGWRGYALTTLVAPVADAKPSRTPSGRPLNWPEETLPDRARPILPPDQEEAAAAFRRDAKRKKPRLLEATPG
jgi:hypothetical protein